MISKAEILRTYHQIKNQVFKTPLVFSPELSKISGAKVYLKMEHLQHTGSFKLRGVLTKINTLSDADLSKTLVAASTGNHAAAFAYVSKKKGLKRVLFLPDNASHAKIKALEQYDIDLRHFGSNCMQTESKAAEYAHSIDGVLIHPYNDMEIVKGQGTIACEIDDQLADADLVLAPIGGGGLISGLCCYYASNDMVAVVGCQPVNASEMYDSIKAGRLVEPSELSTIADATAGGIEEGSVTFDICQKYLADIELCPEDKIKQAIAFMVKYHQTIIEPGAALGVATLLNTDKYKDKNIVVVLTGRKIEYNLLTEILTNHGRDY